MRRALVLAGALTVLLSGCVTTRYQESADLYRWRLVGTDRPKTLVATSVRLSPDGAPWGVRLRVVTALGEIVDYREESKGAAELSIAGRGFETPSELHRTGNTPVVVVTTERPDLEVGMPARKTGAEGGPLSAEEPLTEDEARHATIIIFREKAVTVLAAPKGGRPFAAGAASLLHDRGRSFEIEPIRRGAWVISHDELVKYYAFLPLPLIFDAVLLPVSMTGLALHYAGLDGSNPLVGHEHSRPFWAPPSPPREHLPSLPRPEDASE